MRSLFLILLLANLLVFAAQFDVIRGLVPGAVEAPRTAPLNAERLRIVRDTSARPAPAPAVPAR